MASRLVEEEVLLFTQCLNRRLVPKGWQAPAFDIGTLNNNNGTCVVEKTNAGGGDIHNCVHCSMAFNSLVACPPAALAKDEGRKVSACLGDWRAEHLSLQS